MKKSQVLHPSGPCLANFLMSNSSMSNSMRELWGKVSLDLIITTEMEGDDRGWDGWMASPTQLTWVWASSGSWWWTGRTGMLSIMGLQNQTQLRDWTVSSFSGQIQTQSEASDAEVTLVIPSLHFIGKKLRTWASMFPSEGLSSWATLPSGEGLTSSPL